MSNEIDPILERISESIEAIEIDRINEILQTSLEIVSLVRQNNVVTPEEIFKILGN